MTVSSATPDQYPGVIDILVESFAADPAFLRWIPQPDPGLRKLRGLFELQLEKQYALSGTIDVAHDAEGELLGAALWDAPDGRHSARDQLSLLPSLIRLFGTGTAGVIHTELSSARYHPRFPHWYLYTVATTAAARGRGVGSALLSHGIDRAGEEAIYLEATSTRAAALYARLGFVPLGHLPGNDGTPQELAMWRSPVVPGV